MNGTNKDFICLHGQNKIFFGKCDSSSKFPIKCKSISCSTGCLSHLWCKQLAVYWTHAHPVSSRSLSASQRYLSASFDSNTHGREHALMFTVQPWNSSRRHPAPRSLCIAHILSSALTHRDIDPLTTDRTSNAEPIRRKLPKGEKRGR